MVAPLVAAAGVSALGTIVGTGLQMKANDEALDAAKNAAKLELSQAKRRAKLEDRLFLDSTALSERQLVEGLNLADKQAVASIGLADRQLGERIAEEERQAGIAAAEDRSAIKSQLATDKLNAAQRALDIRRNLMRTLGEQRATLAARGVSSGSLVGQFGDEATGLADEDFRANRINELQAEADAAAGLRAVDTGIANLRSANLITRQQGRETALRALESDREAAVNQLKGFQDTARQELKSARASTKMDLKFQEEAVDLGISNLRTQTRYANIAALIDGFTQIASLGFSAYSQNRAIQPSARASAYQSPRPLVAPSYSSLSGRGV